MWQRKPCGWVLCRRLAPTLSWFYRRGLPLLAPLFPPEFKTYKQNLFSID
jgi:hypothetical protein